MPAPGQTKRTPEVEKRLLDALRLGSTQRLACQYAGISEDTLARWRGQSAEFADALTRAQGELALTLLAKIEQAAARDWRAAAWKLEHRFPKEYGRQILTVEGDSANPLTHLHTLPQAEFDALLASRLRDAGYTLPPGPAPAPSQAPALPPSTEDRA